MSQSDWEIVGSLLLCRIRENSTSKLWFFFNFQSAHEAPIYLAFHLSSLLQMPNVEWLKLSSSTTSRIVLRESASVIAFSWPLSTSSGQSLHSSSSRLSSPLQNFLNHHCTVRLIAVPGSNALLMLWVVFAALQPILNLNEKIGWICFFV